MPDTVRGSEPVVRTLLEAINGASHAYTLVQAPGRVNLIGEHTDYNGGHVLPMALDRVVGVAARKNSRPEHQVISLNYGASCTFAAGSVPEDSAPRWMRYTAGMLREVGKHLSHAPPLLLYVYGDIPLGAGLSSSAALCVATGLALEAISGEDIDPMAMACIAQAVEQIYAGVQCGIMDQVVSRLGKPGHALLLHCDTLKYSHIPLCTDGVRLVLIDSGVRRELATSQYNERRQQCTAALALGRRKRPELQTLCAMDMGDVLDLPSALLRRRALHAVTEDARVHVAADALKKQDWDAFGRYLAESHASLRDLYEVSCREMDCLVDAALAAPEVYGARMIGGGFGGCTINVVAENAKEKLQYAVMRAYRKEFNRAARFHVLGDGLQAGIVREGRS